MDMKLKELDNLINEVLEQEAKKLINEQVDDVDHLIDSVKSFQSLSGFLDKINEIEDAGSDGPMIYISIQNVTPEELVHCCGGDSLEHAQTNLMQGLHHDLEDNGFDGDFDIDVETSGDENTLHLIIRITPINDNTLLGDTEMEEQTKDTNPTADDKKNIILGGNSQPGDFLGGDKPQEVEEKKDEKWIQKAIKPSHEGYCTPITKSTCTPKRKALAKTLKKMAKNESTKKIITLSEEQMAELLKRIVNEVAVPTIDPTTEKVLHDSGKQNDEALKAVEAKIKQYLTFKGNDNPDFPNQIGQGEKKMATQNTDEEDDVVSDNRGRGPQDLDYDNEPSKEFKERQKMSLVGATEMGNSQDSPNAIKTKTGDKMLKNIEKRQKNKSKEPIYPKEQIPVQQKGKEDVRPENANGAVASELERMKQMSEYNKKTQ
jgi:hypothetical protein